ncbi:hypothetical protein OROHE_025198 [Orobanche hederae]
MEDCPSIHSYDPEGRQMKRAKINQLKRKREGKLSKKQISKMDREFDLKYLHRAEELMPVVPPCKESYSRFLRGAPAPPIPRDIGKYEIYEELAKLAIENYNKGHNLRLWIYLLCGSNIIGIYLLCNRDFRTGIQHVILFSARDIKADNGCEPTKFAAGIVVYRPFGDKEVKYCIIDAYSSDKWYG